MTDSTSAEWITTVKCFTEQCVVSAYFRVISSHLKFLSWF